MFRDKTGGIGIGGLSQHTAVVEDSMLTSTESVAKKLDADWWHNGRASLGIKGQSIWGIACAGYCYLL